MTRIEYDLLRQTRPDLRLPIYETLQVGEWKKIGLYAVPKLVAARTARLLSRELGSRDILRYGPSDPL
jgi:hypothetical protein